jgi:ABC-type antimicrobial peptide transport system permease subunit
VTTLTNQVDASMIPERLIATLSGFFGALGALLAAIGLYGLLAFTVARRTAEIGIRMALGATAGGVVRMVLRSALGLVVAGLALGVPLAFAGARLAVTFVDNAVTAPARSIALAVATMIVVALAAAYIPACRASRISPIDALRQD